MKYLNLSLKNSTMNNTGNFTEKLNTGPHIFSIIIMMLIFILHSFVHYIIQKKRLNNSQYYLVRVFSIADITVIIIGLIVNILNLSQYNVSKDTYIIFSMFAYIGLCSSLVVTMCIAVDR